MLNLTIKNKVMKAYTDISQSKKLAEILPLESADIGWNVFVDGTTRTLPINDWDLVKDGSGNVKFYPAWSLAALLDVLPFPQLSKDKLGSGKEGWMVSIYPDNCRYDSCWHDNPIDACYKMIIKLHEQKLL